MADYTSDEIQTAVEKVVRSSIRRPYGDLGNRDTGTSFSDIQDAAAGVFISAYSSPFYVIYLGTLRLAEIVALEEQTLTKLIEAIENTDRRVEEVDNLTSLGNAKVALQALSSAATSREAAFVSMDDVPAFKRYDDNLQKFIDTHSTKIRKRGEIVPTPEESRSTLPGLISGLEEVHEEVKERAAYLQGAIADYDALNLPSLLSADIISNTRAVLSDRIDEMEALSPRDRLAVLKDVSLDLMAGRAAIRGLGSLQATTVFVQIEGTMAPFADADHPALPAELPSDIGGPYPIYVDNNQLDLVLDGTAPLTVSLLGSFLAFIEGSITDPFVIDSTNDKLLVDIDTYNRLEVDIFNGIPPIWVIISQINTAVDDATDDPPLIAEAAFAEPRYTGPVTMVSIGGTDMDVVVALNTWEDLGAKEEDYVYVLDPDADNYTNVYRVLSGGLDGDTLHCQLVYGFSTPATEEDVRISVGAVPLIRMRIKDGREEEALDNRLSITLPADEDNTALLTLGMTAGAVVRSRSIDADRLVDGINKSATTTVGDTPRLEAVATLVPKVYTGKGRTEPTDPNKIVAYTFRGRGDTDGGRLGLVFDVPDALDGGVEVGNLLVIRETDTVDDVNAPGRIRAVDNDSITVDMVSPVSAGTNLLVEVGPDISPSSEYMDLRISNSLSNDGDYTLAYGGWQRAAASYGAVWSIPFEFIVESPLPLPIALGGQPYFFDLEVGYKQVDFNSRDTTLASAISVDGDAASEFFRSPPGEAVGMTPYWSVPEDPKRVEAGDTLELYETQYNDPDQRFTVTSIERGDRVIQVGTRIRVDYGDIELSQTKELPFARIRKLKKDNYTVFSEAMAGWLALGPNLDPWFPELNRLVNPLISNQNPTLSAVNAAKLHAQELQAILTAAGASGQGADPGATIEAILALYETRPVELVDALVDTFLERGADRGVDILLQGRFSEFFGLTQETLSYAGDMQLALQEVSRNDLPIRKTDRHEDPGPEMIEGSWEEPDYEFDLSDVFDNDEEEVDIPGDFGEFGSPGQ